MGEARGRTWYGLPYRIRYGSWCDLEVAGLPMPHPSLINAAIRRGLDAGTRATLTRRHERGHLQTLPLALAYLTLAWPRPASLAQRLAALLGFQAAWELLTETYVVTRDPEGYARAYRRRPNPWAGLFWPVAIVAALAPLWLRGAQGGRP